MKKWTGAQLVRYALEQIGVRWTFGIPGVHNTELYDELAASAQIQPVRVGHEGCGAFMADAISRTTDSIGCLVIVPAAGAAMAANGIGEAYLDGIPMLIISGGVRTDLPYHYQVHEMDQLKLVDGITKARYRVQTHADIVPTLFEAYRTARAGEPGPVFVEIPVNLQLFPAELPALPAFTPYAPDQAVSEAALDAAVALLRSARKPGLFLGWGAHRASERAIRLAEQLNAPVATSLQGLSVFPASHPLHCGMGFGPAAVPAATEAFADCDCVIAVGVRFGEIATGSFGLKQDWKLLHVDINPAVFNVNYRADVAIEGDAGVVLDRLLARLETQPARPDTGLRAQIRRDKKRYIDEWLEHASGPRVNPASFFRSLRLALDDEAMIVADDGNHTFLVAELMPILGSGRFISPTDFNCMGYCVPACIGTALAHPDRQVVGIVGDGAFAMTCMEILTATELGLGIVYFVFSDGELSQIAQAQKLPYNRKTCTVLPRLQVEGVATATGAAYLSLSGSDDTGAVIDRALSTARSGRPVIVDVAVDYSKPTRFTRGILKANFERMPVAMKLRMAGRALYRRVLPTTPA